MESSSAVTGTAQPRVARVRVPGAGIRSDLRAVRVVWQRELIRFSRDRARMITSLVQPVLFLFVLGTGLSRLASAGTHGVNLRTFVYPGVLAMAVLFTAMFSAASYPPIGGYECALAKPMASVTTTTTARPATSLRSERAIAVRTPSRPPGSGYSGVAAGSGEPVGNQSTRPSQRSRFSAYQRIVRRMPSSHETFGSQPVSACSLS